jgi:DNA-binding response OmpR family regulator
MRVVIADDDKVVIRLLSAGLRRSGFEVIPAYDAMQAIMATMRHLPDVVLLDINMPGGTGIEVIRRIRASSKTTLTPILAMTATATAVERDMALELGAMDCLEKPLDIEELVLRLNAIAA